MSVMNSKLCLCCVRCEENARFICARCSDPYCSKTCQVMHWPFHRTMCLSMPSLLELPTSGNLAFPISDTRSNNSPAIEYPNWDAHQSNFSPKPYHKANNYEKSKPPFREIHRNKNHPRNNYMVPKNSNPVLETQRHNSKESLNLKEPTDIREGTQRFPLREKQIQRPQNLPILNLEDLSMKKSHEFENSRPMLENVNQRSMLKETPNQGHQLPKVTKTELRNFEKIMPLQENGAKRLPKESINWEEELSGNPSDPLIWQKAFSLPEHKTEVIVQYFVESPTISCWVIQSQHIKERDNFLAELKKLHSSVKAVDKNEIRMNEVYCVQHEDIYYRGVVVYQINSKEVVVRLIDDGRTFQTLVTAIKPLDPQLKFKNAFVLEINFETSLEVQIGQVLQIEKISIDAIGAINVKLCSGNNEIDLIPVPIGVPMDLFCLDYSNIHLGYISACKNDPDKIESINNLSDKINEYVRKFQKDEKYFPKLDEMCLVFHDDEKEWYRAECVKIIDSSCVEVLFIDFGNTKIVNTSNVRKIVPEFMEPAIMHFFRINGVPRKPSRELIKKIASFFEYHPIFSITHVENLKDMQVIHCPELLNAIQ